LERGRPPATTDISKALPLVRRALKVLSEREVTPQLGLLKSTLLQLDSTFSERDYGASSFRDFMEKVAAAGVVVLRHAGRSMLVEPVEDVAPVAADTVPAPAAALDGAGSAPAFTSEEEEEEEESLPQSPMSMQDGIRAVQQALGGASRWPMYVRQAKQFLKNSIDGFDERKYGFASVVDLLRAAGKEGVLRIERDRQGAIRVFPGPELGERRPVTIDGQPDDATGTAVMDDVVDVEPQPAIDTVDAEAVSEPPILDVVEALTAEPVASDLEEPAPEPGDANGNIAGVATHEMTTTAARKRKSPARGRTSTKTAAAPRRTARKSTKRQKADAR
jgi:hypothetical protein